MDNADQHADLSELLRGTADALDITYDQYMLAVSRYEDLGAWLVLKGIGDPDVYAQGSFRLGTVVRPSVDGQYDIDLVFWRDVKRGSITQEELKRQAGELLVEYVEQRGALVGMPKIIEKGRCWCLDYDEDGFHIDVLPVIPDDEGGETSILLTDRDLRLWQHSNPIGYADWFWAAMGETVDIARAERAHALSRDIEEVPQWLARTPLQRVVQLIKRHRDLFFVDNSEDQPASILLTTLATRAYSGQMSIYAALAEVVSSMPAHIESRSDGFWVPNPAHPKENFADKWNTNPERKEHFDSWLMALVNDVARWLGSSGIDVVTSSLAESFGSAPVTSSANVFGDRLSAAAAAGSLGVSTTGQVTRSSPNTIPKHTFHLGQQPPR